MPKRPRLTRLFWQALACLALLVFLGLPLGAKADGIVQGFSENGDLQPGWIVALSPKAASTVEAAPASNSNRIYGVVINPSDSSLTLRSSGAQVYVATGGNFPVLVSLVNGKIKAGDYISMSNTDGIGAKAKATEPTILGRATQAFDGQHGVLVGSGNNAIGRILANISPQHNPETKGQSSIPSPLKQAADSIAGHTVSVARVWAAVATFFFGFGHWRNNPDGWCSYRHDSHRAQSFEQAFHFDGLVPSGSNRHSDFYRRSIWGIFTTEAIREKYV